MSHNNIFRYFELKIFFKVDTYINCAFFFKKQLLNELKKNFKTKSIELGF